MLPAEYQVRGHETLRVIARQAQDIGDRFLRTDHPSLCVEFYVVAAEARVAAVRWGDLDDVIIAKLRLYRVACAALEAEYRLSNRAPRLSGLVRYEWQEWGTFWGAVATLVRLSWRPRMPRDPLPTPEGPPAEREPEKKRRRRSKRTLEQVLTSNT